MGRATKKRASSRSLVHLERENSNLFNAEQGVAWSCMLFVHHNYYCQYSLMIC